jgi:hypothetical protein
MEYKIYWWRIIPSFQVYAVGLPSKPASALNNIEIAKIARITKLYKENN